MPKYLFAILFSFTSFTGSAQEKTGMASYYHSKFDGRKTASGDIFSNSKMTAASNHYKLGEWVKVTNVANGRSVYVQINDRMAKNSNRLIDLTHQAAKDLSFMQNGLCRVCVEKALRPAEALKSNAQTKSDSLPVTD